MASSYYLLVCRPSPGPPPTSLSLAWPPEGLRRRRESPTRHAVVLRLQSLYFHILARNGVPGVIVVAVRVRVHGGAARAVPESLCQDLHDLEVGYVVFVGSLDQGVLAPVAWLASRRERIRTHLAAVGLRHCRLVGHRFPAAKSHPRTHLREENEDNHCPGYIYPGPWHSSPIGGGREPVGSSTELGAPKAW
jgi:hypothetical protein